MITLKDIRKDTNIRLQKNMYMGHLNDWKNYEYKYGYPLDFDVYLPTKNMNLQRGFVWTLEQKRELIISVIKGTDIQAFYVILSNEVKEQKTYKVIDGKQRLSTLIDFINDKFTIVFDKEYLFSELPSDIQYVIGMFDIHFNLAYEYYDDMISDDDKINWFEQINFTGTIQEKEHLLKLKKTNN